MALLVGTAAGLVVRAARFPGQAAAGIVAAPDHVRALWGRLEAIVGRIDSDLDDVEALVRRVDRTVDAVAVVVESAATVLAEAGANTGRAGDVVARLRRLEDLYEPPLRKLAPVAVESSSRLRPEHARSLGRLLDLLPEVLDQIEPALRNLADLAPGLEQVTERVDDVGEIVEGLPGAKLLQRRGHAKAKEGDEA